jgi:hypothetical protein
MRLHDWAGTVLVACLIGTASLLKSKELIAAILLIAAFICTVVIIWDVRFRTPKDPSLPERLYKLAREIDAFFQARWVEEPRVPLDALGNPIEQPDEDERMERLVAYRKKTMALYYEQHQAKAIGACDEATALRAFPSEHRQIIHSPHGTAALKLIPGLLEDSADRLTKA